MKYTMLAGKIHRATVTDANLHYEGSITVDQDLLDASRILPFSQVHIWNVTSGERFLTYAMSGKRGSGDMVINGAAAHKASRGDIIIVASFVQMDAKEARQHQPSMVYVDGRNAILSKKAG